MFDQCPRCHCDSLTFMGRLVKPGRKCSVTNPRQRCECDIHMDCRWQDGPEITVEEVVIARARRELNRRRNDLQFTV